MVKREYTKLFLDKVYHLTTLFLFVCIIFLSLLEKITDFAGVFVMA